MYRGNVLSTTLTLDVDVAALYPFDRIVDYLTYPGSLTTPGCFETVNWLIAGSPMSISLKQLDELRLAEHSEGHVIGYNNRPVQPLHGRQISATSSGVQKVLSSNADWDATCNHGMNDAADDLAAHAAAIAAQVFPTTTPTPAPPQYIGLMTSRTILQSLVTQAIPAEIECKHRDSMLGILILALVLVFLALVTIVLVFGLRYLDKSRQMRFGMESSPSSVAATLLGKDTDQLRAKVSKIESSIAGLDKMNKNVESASTTCMDNNKALNSLDDQLTSLSGSAALSANQDKTPASKKELEDVRKKVDKAAQMARSFEQAANNTSTTSGSSADLAEVREKLDMLIGLVKIQKL